MKNADRFSDSCPTESCNISKCAPIETFLIVVLFIFGLVLLSPYDRNFYSGMILFQIEEIWGALCVLTSIYQIYVNMKNKGKKFKLIGFGIQTFIWSFMGTSFFVNGIVNGYLTTAFGTYMSIAGLSFYMSYKMRG